MDQTALRKSQVDKGEGQQMRTRLSVIALAIGVLFGFQTLAQTADPVFPKGDLSTVKNLTGEIWLNELNVGDSTFDPSIAQATYGPGAKLDWHIHPGGQVLLITEGTGYLCVVKMRSVSKMGLIHKFEGSFGCDSRRKRSDR
jgi:hypothetical protein